MLRRGSPRPAVGGRVTWHGQAGTRQPPASTHHGHIHPLVSSLRFLHQADFSSFQKLSKYGSRFLRQEKEFTKSGNKVAKVVWSFTSLRRHAETSSGTSNPETARSSSLKTPATHRFHVLLQTLLATEGTASHHTQQRRSSFPDSIARSSYINWILLICPSA